MRGIKLKRVLIACLAAVVAGCGGAANTVRLTSTGLAWPQPPDSPRIEFVGEFSRSTDLGIQPKLWDRFVTLVTGTNREALERPMAVVATGDNRRIFVADPGSNCVHRYDLGRGRYDCLNGGRDFSLDSPVGLAISPGGHLFVSDSKLGKIFQLRPGGRRLLPFEVNVPLLQPTGIAWSEALERLYVTDTGSQSIKVFDRQGALVLEFGRRGSLPGELNFPTYLCLDEGGEVLVTDSLNFRVQRFSADGLYLSSFGRIGNSAGFMARPKGVAVDRLGHIYVTDGVFHAFQVFNAEGDLMLPLGRRGQAPGEFWLPAGLFIGGNDYIYVTDSQNKRVQIFRYVGGDQ